MTENQDSFDAVLMIAFGGPEGPEDIRPFLARVTQGRVPAERLETVARHYELFGGRSPVNEMTFRQAEALKTTLKYQNMPLPVYVGMRNWRPLLVDTVQQMGRDGITRAVGVILSVYQSRSSWDQYQSDVAIALAEAAIDLSVAYTAPLFDQPGFIKTVATRVKERLGEISLRERPAAHVLFTAHSLPYSDPQVEVYANQVHVSAASVAKALAHENWQVAYQSRSGRPHDPWLEPDVKDVLRDLGARGVKHVVAVPIGFVCNNIEVLYDLDIDAMDTARQAGITFLRAETVNDDQDFIDALAGLVAKAVRNSKEHAGSTTG
jgi:ferrochelatase